MLIIRVLRNDVLRKNSVVAMSIRFRFRLSYSSRPTNILLTQCLAIMTRIVSRRLCAFLLSELLVVLVIIGILVLIAHLSELSRHRDTLIDLGLISSIHE